MVKEDCFHLGVKALILKEGKLLLLQLNPQRLKSAKKDSWDIPGGRIQINELLEDALKREVYEETGLKIIPIRPFMMALSHIRIPIQDHDVGLVFATYVCEIVGDISISLSDEHTHFDWFEPNKAAELLKVSYPDALTEKIARWE
jgi:8-oxo-dGTP diphosphatase